MSRPRKLTTPNGRAVKARGRQWENTVVRLLRDIVGWTSASRNGAVHGSNDRGDIGNVPLTVQCKAVDRIQLWRHLDDALTQADANQTGDEAVVVYKRHLAKPEDAAWVLPGSFALRLLHNYYLSRTE
ncbi:hypothetical protein [Amycolatopsis cihanbeyliensis]|uniref:Uncharacterized protein n=1 Tax=Amycolatopsis cihanbeyliensis TaxID=1128664 RepID=A0A542DNH7_AMYCI|nr:hypothetical protein [Amycolatopsis cihanbeyliensis]TQJ04662.1 hypothetical protein FB471_4467 [Amycolatopsis cihanbeyliensis]